MPASVYKLKGKAVCLCGIWWLHSFLLCVSVFQCLEPGLWGDTQRPVLLEPLELYLWFWACWDRRINNILGSHILLWHYYLDLSQHWKNIDSANLKRSWGLNEIMSMKQLFFACCVGSTLAAFSASFPVASRSFPPSTSSAPLCYMCFPIFLPVGRLWRNILIFLTLIILW